MIIYRMHVFILYAYTPCVHLNRAGRGTTVSSAFSFSLYVLLRTCALATSNKICRKTTFHKKRKEKRREEKRREEKKRKEKKRKEKKRKEKKRKEKKNYAGSENHSPIN